MLPETEPGNTSPVFSVFLRLVRNALSFYQTHSAVLLTVSTARLLPFYVLIWYFPINDGVIRALLETVVLVPAVAALIRYEWAALDGIQLRVLDATLGPPPIEIGKLLATNLFIAAVIILFTGGGPVVFFTLTFIWTWATLVSDQAVVIEGQMLIPAVTRSIGLVQENAALTIAAVILVWIPELVSIFLYQAIETPLAREAMVRAVTIFVLPFTTAFVTMVYAECLASADSGTPQS
jgi:hypothetical protein